MNVRFKCCFELIKRWLVSSKITFQLKQQNICYYNSHFVQNFIVIKLIFDELKTVPNGKSV